MKEIPLSVTGKKNKGKYVAIVDDEDYEYLSQFRWTVKEDLNTCYAMRRFSIGRYKQGAMLMHREILGVTDPLVKVDHEDKDGLNCIRSNLRICTHAENLRNNKSHVDGTSKYLGVSWYKQSGKWRATILKDGKQYSCGYHLVEEDAAKAYDEKAKILFGRFANLNFKENEKPPELNQVA